jgi:hypothetical protein
VLSELLPGPKQSYQFTMTRQTRNQVVYEWRDGILRPS